MTLKYGMIICKILLKAAYNKFALVEISCIYMIVNIKLNNIFPKKNLILI